MQIKKETNGRRWPALTKANTDCSLCEKKSPGVFCHRHEKEFSAAEPSSLKHAGSDEVDKAETSQLPDANRLGTYSPTSSSSQREIDAMEYKYMTYRELQDACKNRGLPAGGKKEDLIKRLGIDVSSPARVVSVAGGIEDAVVGGKKEDLTKCLGIDVSFPAAATGAGDNDDAAVGGAGPYNDKDAASSQPHKLPVASKDSQNDDAPRRVLSGNGDESPILGEAPKGAVKGKKNGTLGSDVGHKKDKVWIENHNKDIHTNKTQGQIKENGEYPHVDHIVEIQVLDHAWKQALQRLSLDEKRIIDGSSSLKSIKCIVNNEKINLTVTHGKINTDKGTAFLRFLKELDSPCIPEKGLSPYLEDSFPGQEGLRKRIARNVKIRAGEIIENLNKMDDKGPGNIVTKFTEELEKVIEKMKLDYVV